MQGRLADVDGRVAVHAHAAVLKEHVIAEAATSARSDVLLRDVKHARRAPVATLTHVRHVTAVLSGQTTAVGLLEDARTC